MPYIRTPRAWAWVDEPASETPPTQTTATEGIQWAAVPVRTRHGLCVGWSAGPDGLRVAIKRATTIHWFPALEVLSEQRLKEWMAAKPRR